MSQIIYVDKPKGITSFDICYKLRKVFNTKKIGHTGTLDPNATGLMVCLIGGATKANQFLVCAKKEYIATVKIGIKTDSDDIEGKILEEKEEVMPDFDSINDVLKSFLGKTKQVPPMTSAIKVNGKKLYEYHRQGIKLELESRDIEVFNIELLNIEGDTFTFKTYVSSGTYIRSLANDILNKLGIIGTLSDLRRTKIDDVDIKEADSLDDVLDGKYHVHSIYEVLSKYYYVYNVQDRKHVLDGKPLKIDLKEDMILCAYDNEALAIYKFEDGLYRCLRGLL